MAKVNPAILPNAQAREEGRADSMVRDMVAAGDARLKYSRAGEESKLRCIASTSHITEKMPMG